MTGKTLNVLLADHHAGVIAQRPGGRHRFEYLPSWQHNPRAIPLSYSIPIQQQSHGTRVITDFMWGLLPDNENTLRRWGTRFKVSPHNPFALLTAIGEDCPGAVQIIPPELDLKARQRVKWLSPAELEQRIVALKNDVGAGRLEGDTGQFSLAGSQEKTALYRVNNRWGVPQGRTPTTHILKPETGRVTGIAANEHFCLHLARLCQLPAAISELQIIGDIPVIILQRFDRVRGKDKGVVRRVHQEDMCQALANRKKYQQEGGPGIYEIMNLLQFSDNPETDRDRFMRAQALNYVIAGTDAHARNYSIIYAPGGAFRLAPLYDVISDLPYVKKNGTKSTLAMTIGGKRAIGEILPGHWERQAASVKFSADRIFQHLRDLIAILPEVAESVEKQVADEAVVLPIVRRLREAIEARCAFLGKYYGAERMNAAT